MNTQLTSVCFNAIPDQALKSYFNGCGGPGFRVPSFGVFTPACLWHDLAYVIGGTDTDRLRADRMFLRDMLKRRKKASWWKRWLLKIAARTYYSAVRLAGRKHFHITEKSPSWDDLRGRLKSQGKVAVWWWVDGLSVTG